MYKTPKMTDSLISVNSTTEGESIETKVTRLIQNKEPIKDAAPLIFTDKKDGVNAAYNIRTDRWEIAVEAMDKIRAQKAAKNAELIKTPEAEAKVLEMDGKAKSIQGEAS